MSNSSIVNEMKNQEVGELLSEDYRRAKIFQKHDIDFCCGGDRTLETVCETRGLDPDELVRELTEVTTDRTESEKSFDEMGSEKLINLVQNKHHQFTEEAIARISGYLDKVRKVHGDNHPEVVELAELWVEMGPEMLQHMKREDDVLFPYAREMLNAREPDSVDRPQGQSAEDLIESMEGEHDETGDRLYAIKDLTNDFTPPEDACKTFRALYCDLEEFVDVTMEHVFIENTVLFPGIIECEQSVQ